MTLPLSSGSDQTIDTSHLIVYRVYQSNDNRLYTDVSINTLLLTDITWTKGRRRNKQDAIRRRLYKAWKKNHPILKRCFIPFRFWDTLYMDYWMHAKIEIEYSSDTISILMGDNDTALREFKRLRKTFWKENE